MNWHHISIWLLFSHLSFGQIEEFPSSQKGLLWKISGNGLNQSSYVFGTMHLMDSESFLFPSTLDSIVRQSDQLIMELGQLPDPLQAMQLLTLKEGSFFDYFTKKECEQLFDWALKNLNMDERTFRLMVMKWKPFALAQLLTQMAFQGETSSYEMKLYTIANEQDLPVIGLETPEEQVSFFDNLSIIDQKNMVLSALNSIESLKEEMIDLQSLYRNEQIDSLTIYISHHEASSSISTAEFLDKRNLNWLNELGQILREDKRFFIAVGAAHLGGKNGLIRGLQTKGYIVTPYKLSSIQ